MTQAMVTDGTIALRNLEAQIEGLQPEAALCRAPVEERVRLIDLLALRGSILGTIADYERAQELADRLVHGAITAAPAFFARAQARALFHRFADALEDLEVAESLGALTTLHAERGDTERAVRLHTESVRRYRGISPLPLATLNFQLGVMWMREGDFYRARDQLTAARRYVAAYVPAQGHLAEVEAELGDAESAVALLYPLATTSDDPDYAGQLARILADAGSTEESRYWRQHAAERYDELIALHPEAFADHAADFWLGAGAEPEKALRLARMNFAIRKTPRARALLSRAVAACEAASA